MAATDKKIVNLEDLRVVVNDQNDRIDTTVSEQNASIGNIINQNNVLGSRISAIESGTTPEGSEIVDVRVDVHGTTHSAAGDAVRAQVNEVQESINSVVRFTNVETEVPVSLFPGGIYTSSGGDSNSSTRIRTAHFGVGNGVLLTVPLGMKALYFYYGAGDTAASRAYLGYSGPNWSYGDVFIKRIDQAVYIRIVLAYDNNASITPANYSADEKLLVTRYARTDTTLSESGKAADAKTVGDTIAAYSDVIYAEPVDLSVNFLNGYIITADQSNKGERGSNQTLIDKRLLYSDTSLVITAPVIVSLDDDRYKFVVVRYRNQALTSGNYIDHLGYVSGSILVEPVPDEPRTYLRFMAYDAASGGEATLDSTDIANVNAAFSVREAISQKESKILRGLGWLPLPPWVQGARQNSGRIADSNGSVTFSRGIYVGAGARVRVSVADGYVVHLFYGYSATGVSLRFASSVRTGTYTVPGDYLFVTVIRSTIGVNLPMREVAGNCPVTLCLDTADDDVHDMPDSLGAINVVKRAKQLVQLGFTALADYPYFAEAEDEPEEEDDPDGGGGTIIVHNDIPAGTDIIGVPYSAVWTECQFVPQAVSIHTYMTALLNPNSYIYTREKPPTDTGHAMAYYGTVCSAFVDHCYGIDKTFLITAQLPYMSGMTRNEDQSIYGLKVGDLLSKFKSHVAIVTDIVRSRRTGEIRYIVTADSWRPYCRMTIRKPADYQSTYRDKGYYAFRWNDLRNVEYTPSPWVHIGDETGDPTYSTHLCPRRGDRANWPAGETVEVDVLDADIYTGWKVTKDGGSSAYRTGTIPSGSNPIRLTNLPVGTYELCLTKSGADDSEKVSFIVYDHSETYTNLGNGTVRCAFSSTNAQPVSVLVQHLSANISPQNVRQPVELTNADRSRGYVDINCGAGNFKVRTYYRTEYGLITSENLSHTVS